MGNDIGRNESRTLTGGEIVYLIKHPDSKWTIRSYECRHNVHLGLSFGGLVFEYLQGLPKEWKNREFESVDAAIAFVQREVTENKVPHNNE